MDLLPPESVIATSHQFLELLERWNRTHALTALLEEHRFEELILDSWALVPHLSSMESGARVVDFGTGMGVPAVVLAIARPDLEILALDKARKKVAFVRQVAMELRLENLRPLSGRAEDVAPLNGACGVAKAVGSPALLTAWWDRHGAVGAPLFALKGESWEQEPRPGEGWSLSAHPYRLPTRGERIILEFRKKNGLP